MTRTNTGPGPGIEAVAHLVATRTGLSFPESRWTVAEAAVRRGQKHAGLRTLGPYLELLRTDESAFEHLVNELTVGETYFFRDPAQFEFIGREVVPGAVSRRGGLRAWSAGCATGEEPYSLAILLDQLGHSPRGAIFGTDIAGARLTRARRAQYGRWSLRGCPEGVVDRYFEKTRARYRLVREIRSAVRFSALNLAEPGFLDRRPDLRNMDLVLCRNVMIYLDAPTVARVAEGLLEALDDGGWLLLGASDPPLNELVRCRVEVTDAGLAYQRVRDPRPLRVGSDARGGDAVRHPGSGTPATGTADRPPSRARPGLRPSGLASPGRRRRAAGRKVPSSPPPGEWCEIAEEAACVADVRTLLNGNRLAEAETAIDAALERHAGSAEIAYLRAVLLSELGRHAEAIRAARGALYLDRGLLVGHIALGRALADVGDHDGASRALRNAERALATLPGDAVVPGGDGVLATDLVALVRARIRLLNPGSA